MEACGTSGMKVLPNGGLNLSILDGWWAEAYQPEVGWAIGEGEEYDDHDYQDDVESQRRSTTCSRRKSCRSSTTAPRTACRAPGSPA